MSCSVERLANHLFELCYQLVVTRDWYMHSNVMFVKGLGFFFFLRNFPIILRFAVEGTAARKVLHTHALKCDDDICRECCSQLLVQLLQ